MRKGPNDLVIHHWSSLRADSVVIECKAIEDFVIISIIMNKDWLLHPYYWKVKIVVATSEFIQLDSMNNSIKASNSFQMFMF